MAGRNDKKEASLTDIVVRNADTICAVVGVSIVTGFALSRFHTAAPNQLLVRSGFGVGSLQRFSTQPKLLVPAPTTPPKLPAFDATGAPLARSASASSPFLVDHQVDVGRWFVQFPFQHIWRTSLEPRDFVVHLHAMSKEKLSFTLPAHFIIGVNSDDHEYVKRFAKHLQGLSLDEQRGIVENIILGQARVLAAGLGIEEIFKGQDAFRESMIGSVAEPLSALGLHVINANFSDLGDDEGSNYFKELSKSIQAQATNRAKAEVAKQDKEGTIGEKERRKEARIMVSQLERDAKLAENENQAEISVSEAKLEKKRAEMQLVQESARIMAATSAAVLRAEREADVSKAEILTRVETQRATNLSKTQVEAEIQIKVAEGNATAVTKDAEGKARSIRLVAEAERYRVEQEAQAQLVAAKTRAEGTFAELEAKARGLERVYDVQATGFKRIAEAFADDENGHRMLQYIAMDREVVQAVSKSQADALRDMKPQVTVWAPTGQNAHDTLRSFVPSLKTVFEQAGIFDSKPK